MIHLLLLLAAILLTAGAALIYIPAGLIVAGLSCAGAWYLLDGGSR